MASSASDLEGLLAEVEGCRRLARRLVRDSHGGDDVAQDALLTGWQRASARRKGWGPWLRGIVRNKARESGRAARRRERYEHTVPLRGHQPSTLESVARVETQKLLLDAMLRLSDAQRTVIVRRFFDGQPPRRIASELGVPIETVRTRLKRALHLLRAELTEQHDGSAGTWRIALMPVLVGGGSMGSKTKWAIAALALLLAAPFLWWGLDSWSEGPVAPPDGAEVLLADADGEAPAEDVGLTGRGDSRSVEGGAFRPLGDNWLRGRVVDLAGVAQADVEVQVWAEPPTTQEGDRKMSRWTWRRAPADGPVRTLRTDLRGRFAFDDLPDDGRFLVIRAHPTAPRVGSSQRIHTTTISGQAVVLTTSAGASLEGRVVDAEGQGLAAELEARMVTGALATRWGENGVQLRGIHADESGSFRVPALPVGVAEIEVHVEGRVRRLFRVPVPGAGVRLQVFDSESVTVHGLVSDRAGAPVAGARVSVPIYERSRGVHAYGLALTDERGRYRATGLPAGDLGKVVFDADGYVAGNYGGGGRLLEPGASFEANATLALRVVLQGTVRDEHGAPVVGMEIDARGPSYGHVRAATGADGAFRFDVTPGAAYAITGRGGGWYLPAQSNGKIEGLKPAQLHSKIPATEEVPPLDLVAVRGAAVDLRVVDAAGAPVAGAIVSARVERTGSYESHAFFEWQPRGLRTAADGRCRLSGLPPGYPWTIEVRRGTALARTKEPLKLGPDRAQGPIEFVLREGARLAGRVLDAENRPVVGIGAALMTTTNYAMRTASDGSFAFDGIAPGTYTLRITRGTQQKVDFTLAWGEKRDDVVVRVSAHKPLRGVLRRADGSVLALTELWVFEAASTNFGAGNTVTDAEGRFELQVGATGRYRIRVGRNWAEGEWGPGEEIDAVVRADDEKTFELRILDPEGARVPRAKVSLTRMSGGHSMVTTQDVSDGTWIIQQPAEGESLTLEVRETSDAEGNRLDLQGRRVHVAAGESQVEIRLTRGRRVVGLVEDEIGAPVAGVFVQSGTKHGGATDAKGRFVLTALPPGEITLKFRLPSEFLPTPPVVLDPSQQEVVVRVSRGESHPIRVVGPDGKPVEGANVTVSGMSDKTRWNRRGVTDARGVFLTKGLRVKGAVRVKVRAFNATPPHPDAVRDVQLRGEETVIELEPTVWIEGVALTEEGKPISGAGIRAAGAVVENRGAVARVRSDAAGRFRLGPVAKGYYNVFASGGGFGDSEGRRVLAPASEVRMVLPRVAKVEGTLHDENGAAGWMVQFRHDQHGWNVNFLSGGRFHVDRVSDVVGVLYAAHRDGRYALIENVRPSDGPFDLHPVKGAVISGRIAGYLGYAKGPYVVAKRGGVMLFPRVMEKDGRFEIGGVPPGRWKLVLRMDVNVVGEREVEAGATGLVLEFTPPKEGR